MAITTLDWYQGTPAPIQLVDTINIRNNGTSENITLVLTDDVGFDTAIGLEYTIRNGAGNIVQAGTVPFDPLALPDAEVIITMNEPLAEFADNFDSGDDQLFVDLQYFDTNGVMIVDTTTYNLVVDVDNDAFIDTVDFNDNDARYDDTNDVPVVQNQNLELNTGRSDSFGVDTGAIDEVVSTLSLYSITDDDGNIVLYEDMAVWDSTNFLSDYDRWIQLDAAQFVFKDGDPEFGFMTPLSLFNGDTSIESIQRTYTYVVKDEYGELSDPKDINVLLTNTSYGTSAPTLAFGNGQGDYTFTIGDTEPIGEGHGVVLLPGNLTDDADDFSEMRIHSITTPDFDVIPYDVLDDNMSVDPEFMGFEKTLSTDLGTWYFNDQGPGGKAAYFAPGDITDPLTLSEGQRIQWRFVDSQDKISDFYSVNVDVVNLDATPLPGPTPEPEPTPEPAPDNGGGDDGGGDPEPSPEPAPEPTPEPLPVTPPPAAPPVSELPPVFVPPFPLPEPPVDESPVLPPVLPPPLPEVVEERGQVRFSLYGRQPKFDKSKAQHKETLPNHRDHDPITGPELFIEYDGRIDDAGYFDDGITIKTVGTRNHRRKQRRAMNTDVDFVYNKKRDRLYFNANGEEAGYFTELTGDNGRERRFGGMIGRLDFEEESTLFTPDLLTLSDRYTPEVLA